MPDALEWPNTFPEMSSQLPDIANSTGFDALIGLEYDELSGDRVTARWDVRPELHQPHGLVHGGVHCAVVETAASIGAALWAEGQFGAGSRVVGVNNSTDFYRAVGDGRLSAVATPVHRGRSQQVWQVVITDGEDRLVARGQVRLQNLEAGRGPAAG
jgi:uncharacterized protein (TIGR00369 family)